MKDYYFYFECLYIVKKKNFFEQDFTLDGSRRCDYTGNLRGRCADEHIVIPAQGMKKLKVILTCLFLS